MKCSENRSVSNSTHLILAVDILYWGLVMSKIISLSTSGPSRSLVGSDSRIVQTRNKIEIASSAQAYKNPIPVSRSAQVDPIFHARLPDGHKNSFAVEAVKKMVF